MKSIHDYTILFVLINIFELIMSLILLLLKKRDWQDYLLCFYGGFLFGMIPSFVMTENITAAFILCIVLSVVLIYIQKKYKTKLYIPLGIVTFKILLVIAITIFAEQYSFNMLKYYLIIMFVSMLLWAIINLLHELTLRQQQYVIWLLALLEFSGAMMQFYRIDYASFEKDLLSKESIPFFLYLLKVDFWIFDYQYLYIICFFVFLFIYFVWRKIISMFK